VPTGETLRELFRGFSRGDDAAFGRAAAELVREERAKNHRLLADDLEKILREGRRTRGPVNMNGPRPELPKDRERGFPLMSVSEHDYAWDRLVIPSSTLKALMRIADEHQRRDLLIAGGVRPKQRVLFFGPPGCGKTLSAKVLASVLDQPLVTVRFDAVISSYLGETAANLRRVFDFAEQADGVILFDEFDAIGSSRDNPFDHGELKRVVNTLLQLMDNYRGNGLLIAATNHQRILDPAIWRRFEALVEFPMPSVQDRILLLRRFLKSYPQARLPLSSMGRNLVGATGADIEMITVEAIRSAILDGRREITLADFSQPLHDFKRRFRVQREAVDSALERKAESNEIDNERIGSVDGGPSRPF
jgi:SpoVK/Ycf46/Vps4 family AAA+-type ATPase